MIKNTAYRFFMGGVSLAAIVARSIDQLPGTVVKKPLSWYSPAEQQRIRSLADGL